MRLLEKFASGINRLSFDERALHRRHFISVEKHVQHGTVEMPLDFVRVVFRAAFVFRQRPSRLSANGFQLFAGQSEQARAVARREVEALRGIDERSDDGGIFLLSGDGPLESAPRIVFPKIKSLAQPLEAFRAFLLFAGANNAIGIRAGAAVKTVQRMQSRGSEALRRKRRRGESTRRLPVWSFSSRRGRRRRDRRKPFEKKGCPAGRGYARAAFAFLKSGEDGAAFFSSGKSPCRNGG
ncbi:MAG TPA: hypothetical protein IAC75_01520 [Candidatus Spyradosoma merdigallinarum]|uniref:Uncharacterized protein n=1 Tax=Candidatus Spyradosoma merdigallinarum TaxID=2840950 RepID=A0A9D1NJX2_9BACT|nr:hypothetical protein [Candidatus Spyradosoma merdigallinarum]